MKDKMVDWFLGDVYILVDTCIADFVKEEKN